MNDSELISALRNLKVNTKSAVCGGCIYPFDFKETGCHLIGLAADRLEAYSQALCAPSRTNRIRFVTDFERCPSAEALARTLAYIDSHNNYMLSFVTQDASGVYTVIFCRPARE